MTFCCLTHGLHDLTWKSLQRSGFLKKQATTKLGNIVAVLLETCLGETRRDMCHDRLNFLRRTYIQDVSFGPHFSPKRLSYFEKFGNCNVSVPITVLHRNQCRSTRSWRLSGKATSPQQISLATARRYTRGRDCGTAKFRAPSVLKSISYSSSFKIFKT